MWNTKRVLVFTFATFLVFTVPLSPELALAAQCYTDDVRPQDLGGGVPWDQQYFLDVYGAPRDDGFFLYQDPMTNTFDTVDWSPIELLPDGGIRFGVSTWWAYTHWWWDVAFWRYVYEC